MYVMYYVSMLRSWQLVRILVKTNHPSCPHAHQQNGSAECKHRHIVKGGLSILARASTPLKFWYEAFVSAIYLINRTPSKVIQFSTTLE
jgi:hypothetical protein